MGRDYVLRWLHLGFRDPRYRDVIEKQRRISKEHVEEIWAEQEALDATRRPGRKFGHHTPLDW